MEPSEASGQSAAASRGLRQVMRQRPLFSFFFMAYAFSWLISIPYVLSSWGIMPAGYNLAFLLFALKAYAGPTLAALIMTSLTEGRVGVRRLRHRITQWRAGWRWYVFILVGIPALLLLGIIVQPGLLASFQGLTRVLLVSYPVAFVAIFLETGLPEEIGWRGFALPRMQPRYGPLWGTLLLGVLWAFWHLLYFLTPDQGGGPGTGFATFLTNFPIFLLFVVALAIIFTWVFNHTQGSVFISSLLHTSVDAPQVVWVPLFLAVGVTTMNLAALIGFGVPALLIIILTRGRLGYQP
jgi:membrane protease YdiL (CAAX protease family)